MTFHHRRPDVCLPPIFVRMCHLFLFYVESYLSTTRFSDLLSGAVTNDSLGKSIFLFGLGDNFTSSTVQSVEVMSISQQSRRDLLTNLLECTIKLRRTNGITWGDKLPWICGYKTSGKYKVVVTGHDATTMKATMYAIRNWDISSRFTEIFSFFFNAPLL